ncbi:hypothetical protein C445_14282 [Halobiforma lacisalsi AJ5]|uniref:Uncharacterized protein n=1 Tax=Natronobacterium lacisalsi AJ5 TaxID=358396 RepID=M0LDK4_NATLA|nr:hypothetical protein C445_14282 [Halobiforma lacisalsi AJ5]
MSKLEFFTGRIKIEYHAVLVVKSRCYLLGRFSHHFVEIIPFKRELPDLCHHFLLFDSILEFTFPFFPFGDISSNARQHALVIGIFDR